MEDITVCTVVFVDVVNDDKLTCLVADNIVLFLAGTEVVVMEKVLVDTEVIDCKLRQFGVSVSE